MKRLTALALFACLACVWTAPVAAAGAARDDSGSLLSGGVTRTYLIHLPASYDGRHAVPLVLVFHGGGGQPPGMVWISGMNDAADRHGFITVYPAGLHRQWQMGGP